MFGVSSGPNAGMSAQPRTAEPERTFGQVRFGPCVDGSGLARTFFTSQACFTSQAWSVQPCDRNNVTFVSVTQSFNTTTSMGRLTLNILLSFAQFEHEVIGERIRDKFAASRKKGIWMGGFVPLG